MEQKLISKAQVSHLHEFARKKDIVFVDLRIELVDHLCELIEERWKDHPNESFKDAFHAVYKSFGIFGFADIAAKHQSQMSKRYVKEIGRYFWNWLKPPQIFATLLVYYLIFYSLKTMPSFPIYIAVLTGITLISSIVISILLYRQNLKIVGEKNVLMSGVINGLYWVCHFGIQIPLLGSGFKTEFLLESPYLLSFLFMFIVLFGLANYTILKKSAVQLHQIKARTASLV